MPSPSPTTTRAVKLKRRPPFTTLATRLIATTRSMCALFSGAPPRPPSRPPRPSRPCRSPPCAGPVPPRRCCPGIRCSFSRYGCSSEVEAVLAGAVGQGGDPAGVGVAAAVEDDLLDAGGLCALGDEGADGLRVGGLVALAAPDRHVEGRRARQGVALEVVHDLRRDVPRGAGHDEAGTGRRAGDLLAETEVPAGLAQSALGRDVSHYLPVFPTLSLICSPS